METELKYQKAMMISVGTGKDVDHGIYFTIDSQNPNFVFFIVSKDSKERTLPRLIEKLKTKKPNLIIELFENEEVNDVQKLHRTYSAYINNLLNKGFLRENITADFTSGTKAMSSALVSAALSLEVGKLSYIYGDRDKDGRVLSGTERVNSLYPSAIFSVKKINRFIDLFNVFQFEGASKILDSEEIHPEYSNIALMLLSLAKIYSAWDKFNFKAAFNNLKEIEIAGLREIKLKGKFSNDSKILSILCKDELSYEKIFDLIANAERRFKEGKYDDGMARLYRLLEMIAQIEFKNIFHCPTNDVKLSSINSKYHQKIKHKYYDSYDKKIKIPLSFTYSLLADKNNKIGLVFEKNKTTIKKLLGQRNQSILAHGSTPINKVGFEKMFEFIKKEFMPLLPQNKLQKDFQFPKINILIS